MELLVSGWYNIFIIQHADGKRVEFNTLDKALDYFKLNK